MKVYKIVNPLTGTEKSFETLEQAKKVVENYYYKDFEKKISKETVEKVLKRYLLSKNRADLNYEMYYYNKARRL